MIIPHIHTCFSPIDRQVRISNTVALDFDPGAAVSVLLPEEPPVDEWQGDGIVRVIPWWRHWEGALLNFGSACPPTNLTFPLLTTLNPTVPTLLSPSHAHVPKIALISLSGCTYREKLAVARAAPVGVLVGIIFHSPSDPSFLPSPLPSSSPLLLGQSPNSSPLDQLGTVPPDPDDDIRGALSACDHIQPVLKVNSTVGAALLAGLGRHAEPIYAYAVVGAAGAKPTMNRTTGDDMGGWPPALPSPNGNPWFVGLAGLGIIVASVFLVAAVYLRRRSSNYLAQHPLHQIVITYKDPSGTSVQMALPYPV